MLVATASEQKHLNRKPENGERRTWETQTQVQAGVHLAPEGIRRLSIPQQFL